MAVVAGAAVVVAAVAVVVLAAALVAVVAGTDRKCSAINLLSPKLKRYCRVVFVIARNICNVVSQIFDQR